MARSLATAIGVVGVLYPKRAEPARRLRPRAQRGLTIAASCQTLPQGYVTERGEVLAVAGIDLEVETGRYAAIIGRSGSGKSWMMAWSATQPAVGRQRRRSTASTSGACRTSKLAAFRNRRIGFVFPVREPVAGAQGLVDNVALPAMLGRARGRETPTARRRCCSAA